MAAIVASLTMARQRHERPRPEPEPEPGHQPAVVNLDAIRAAGL